MANVKERGKESPPNKEPRNSKGSSEDDYHQESSKAAKQALAAQRKAKESAQSAAGAGDTEERQKLLKDALNKEIEAESFGKVAKYLNSGAFQGLAAGGAIGVFPGATLGTVVGTLVGGVTSVLTGGLGAAVGSAAGAIGGPMFKLGDMAGDTVQKVTGNLPGWNATEEQKSMLEKMLGGVQEQKNPSESDLETMISGGGRSQKGAAASGKLDGGGKQQTWGGYAASYMPSAKSMPSWSGQNPNSEEPKNQRQGEARAINKKPQLQVHQEDKATSGEMDVQSKLSKPAAAAPSEKKQVESTMTDTTFKGSTPNDTPRKAESASSTQFEAKTARRTRSASQASDSADKLSQSRSTGYAEARSTQSSSESPSKGSDQASAINGGSKDKVAVDSPDQPRRKPKKLESRASPQPSQASPQAKKKPAKLESRASAQTSLAAAPPKKRAPKLERRSEKLG